MVKTKPELQKIASIVKFAAKAEAWEITGVKDSGLKIWACYMAKKLTKYSNREIAAFFQIDPHFMQKHLEHSAIDFLVDPSGLEEMERMCCLYQELFSHETC
jgi:intracellular sulfur oxidation DsrE/DsrF family protein